MPKEPDRYELGELGRGAWVRMSDIKPPIEEPLLVWCRADLYRSGKCEIHQHPQVFVAKLSNGEWQSRNDDGYWDRNSRVFERASNECLITHWMFLPLAPDVTPLWRRALDAVVCLCGHPATVHANETTACNGLDCCCQSFVLNAKDLVYVLRRSPQHES